MNETIDALRARLDAFSRQLHAKTRNFEVTGELLDKQVGVRNRAEEIEAKLDRAIRAGAVPDVLRLELEQDLYALVADFARVEKEFDAAAMKKRPG